MAKKSAGILAYRFSNTDVEVLLVHPGGPYYLKKDKGVWSIPKGEYEDPENSFEVALKEFKEETGNTIEDKRFIPLSPVIIKSGKKIMAWAVGVDFDRCFISSNEFEMEWPPKSGRKQFFPEVDKADWFVIEKAKEKINPGQLPLIEELKLVLSGEIDL